MKNRKLLRPDWCKNISESLKGNKHPGWKGEKVGYWGIHKWIIRNWGQPKKCEKCKKDNLIGRQINWANKSGKYLRERNDWLRLCRKCHLHYDNIFKKSIRPNINGKNNPFYGKKHSEETKEKMRKSAKLRKKKFAIV